MTESFKQLNVHVPGDLKDRLAKTLRRENKPLAEFVRDAIMDYLKRHEEGNPVAPLSKWQENPRFRACPTVLELDKFKAQWRFMDRETQVECRAQMTRAMIILDELIPPTDLTNGQIFKALDPKIRKRGSKW